jgi:hypothetical protein
MGVSRIRNEKYFGYRAQRSAGGEVRRKYFSLAPGAATGKGGKKPLAQRERLARAKAEAYDRVLARWQAELRQEELQKAIPIRPTNNTGVRGITYRPKYRMVKRGRTYRYAVFEVSVQKPDGRSLMRRIRVYPGSERPAWRAACDCLAAVKKLSARSLYLRFPRDLF